MDTFTDQRDGNVYRTVKIGEQVWLAENFNYETEGSAFFNDNPIYGEKYGRLYDFETAKKVCPVGWHLPTCLDWDELFYFVASFYAEDPYDDAGKHLKSKSSEGEDSFGFAALLGGSYSFKGLSIDEYGLWWSADKYNIDDDNLACSFSMNCYEDYICRHDTWIGDKLSVRYVKD